MTEDSVRYSKGSSYTSETQSDAIVSIPILIAELYGENASLHIPALRHLLDIIIDYPDNIEFVIRYKLTPVLIKFVKNVEPSEKFTKEQNGIQKQKIFQDIIIPIAIINNDKLELNLSDVDEVAKRINKKSNKDSTFSLKKIMENGIYALEIQFLNTDIYTIGIGIVKDTYNIPEGSYPNSNPNIQHIAFYGGINLNGGIFYQGSITQGNAPFKENQMIRAEFDSEKGTLCFFIDGKQQPVFISGIKEKIRFMIHMHNKDAVCIIHSLKQIAVPTAGHVAGEKSVQW
ncbi:MAG: hypothetical protein EZS28_000085 [Streblomastix strix]|uniref:B30.2/SPRY domain-containing protein n=1 Tax=Streblomastix strix TaxID=222440 RepID=A0A5J4XAV4_9EUKA|nr:MAG: hypothetical protein EZS28_000085 [Streblomastix strix]